MGPGRGLQMGKEAPPLRADKPVFCPAHRSGRTVRVWAHCNPRPLLWNRSSCSVDSNSAATARAQHSSSLRLPTREVVHTAETQPFYTAVRLRCIKPHAAAFEPRQETKANDSTYRGPSKSSGCRPPVGRRHIF